MASLRAYRMDRSLRAYHLFVTSDMDGSLLNELEFFPPTDKSASSVAVAGGVQSNNFGQGALGLYQNEESVDFSSWIPDVFSEVPTAVVAVPSPQTASTAPGNTNARRSYREAPSTNGADASSFSSSAFGSFCSPPTNTQPPSNAACINMYDSENSAAAAGLSLPHSRTNITSLGDPTSLLMPMDDPLAGTRPAPGKSPKKSGKKKIADKSTKEYREKRERNNVAVRKSREKNRVQIMETQRRVKDLEDENSALQSKITLLSKELKVLKDLFASAGVSQPASLCLKSEPEN